MPPLKRVEEWTVADLRSLIEHREAEGERLEFKQEFYLLTDDGNRELLWDVAAMANQAGGFIVIVIAEDENGVAKQLVGIQPEPEEKLEGRVLNVVLSGIEPRLPESAVRVRRISLSDGEDSRVALVIQVPRSLAGPCMVRFKERREFWIRHGVRRVEMAWQEVRVMFERSLQAAMANQAEGVHGQTLCG